MKMHPPLYRQCVETLYSVFVEDCYAEKLVDVELKRQKKWGARDRRQFAETIYEMVRWWRKIAHLSGLEDHKLPLPGRSEFTGDSGRLIVQRLLDFYLSDPDRCKRESLAPETIPRVVRHSTSDEFDQWGAEELGEENWEKLLVRLNQPASQYLRRNTLKTSTENLIRSLASQGVGVETVAGTESALRLKERKNVFVTEAFKGGQFEMQDVGSQKIAPLLDVQPGQRVIDACAGAGGKTLHLADLMAGRGQIVALDIHLHKLNELKLRARRAGVHMIETRVIDGTKVIKRLADSCDRLLLDVPCSGLGVVRRHPDTKWKFQRAQQQSVYMLQGQILTNYSEMLKRGGKMVYATCSLAPGENEKQVRIFLESKGTQFELEEEVHISPLNEDSDGFYAARLAKK